MSGPMHSTTSRPRSSSAVGEFVMNVSTFRRGFESSLQARERDRRKREALLHSIQQLTVHRVMFAPIMDMRALMAVGPRVAEHGINLVPMALFPSWEDMRLKGQ
jgi:hypothetical protein